MGLYEDLATSYTDKVLAKHKHDNDRFDERLAVLVGYINDERLRSSWCETFGQRVLNEFLGRNKESGSVLL